ncbi:MAG: MFS transporter [Deltaproteobacteria bacterium]|nr:MFS transporter [Deltaproteobacteria bacterium]
MHDTRKTNRLKSPYIWTFTTYFTEGFPYTIIRTISSLFLRDMNVRLESIGLTSLFGLPWILKFLWGPQVDRFSTKRSWMLYTQFLLSLMMMLAAFFAPFSWGITAIVILFFVGSIIAATHDIAIDGYYMEALDEDGQAKFVGYRVMAYRIAMMAGTGIIATIGTTVDWSTAFLSAGVIFGFFFLYHIFFLPKVENVAHSFKELFKSFLKPKIFTTASAIAIIVIGIRTLYVSEAYASLKAQYPVLKKVWFSHWVGALLFLSLLLVFLFRNKIKAIIMRDPDSFYAKAFATFADREKIGVILAFIIFLRTGEFMLTSMLSPFFVDLGIKVHYGWLSSFVGLPLSIIGAMLGGFCISKFSLKRVIWPFLLLQNLTNIIYMILAFHLSNFIEINTGVEVAQPIGALNLFWVAFVHGFDQLSGGLGTAVLMTFLMRICLKEFKAAHYAIGTGLMSISGVFAGVLSGFLVSWFGYGFFFGISFCISVPGMIVVFFIPHYVFSRSTGTLQS